MMFENIVYEGNHHGYDFMVRNVGHYLADVNIPKGHRFYKKDYCDDMFDCLNVYVHGCLTFSGPIKEDDDWWIGWDYGHYGDDKTSYQLSDIIRDCCDVIMQIDIDETAFNFNVKAIESWDFEFNGQAVSVIIFEPVNRVEIIKIVTDNHDLGIDAEGAWINFKYPDYKRIDKSSRTIKLNGENVNCIIITIKNEKDKKYLFFDRSDYINDVGYEDEDEESLFEAKVGAFGHDDWWTTAFTMDEQDVLKSVDENIKWKDSFSIADLQDLFFNDQIEFNIKTKICKKIVELADTNKNYDTIRILHMYYNDIIKDAVDAAFEQKNKHKNEQTSFDFVIQACLAQIEIASKYADAQRAVQHQRYFRYSSKNEYEKIQDYFRIGPHMGYEKLSLAYYMQGKYIDSIKVAQQAKEEGWEGKWDNRIKKAQKKLTNENIDK